MKRIFLITFCLLCALSLFACGKRNSGALLPPESSSGNPEISLPNPSVGESVTPSAGASTTPSAKPSVPSSTPSPSPSAPAESEVAAYAVSKVNGLTVRKKASASSGKLGSLDKGDAVVLLGKENGFYKTVYKEQTAYVSAEYCTQMEIPKAKDSVEKTVAAGATLLGYPYVWGSQRYHWGNGVLNPDFEKGEFDCSALMQYAFYQGSGALLSLTTRTQVLQGKAVSRENIARGDLLFFTNASRKNKTGVERIGHVALYLGNNYILHTASDHAVIEPISTARWGYYECARRI